MRPSIIALLGAIRSSLQTRAELEAEIVALRHQLAVLQQTAPQRLRLSRVDRVLSENPIDVPEGPNEQAGYGVSSGSPPR